MMRALRFSSDWLILGIVLLLTAASAVASPVHPCSLENKSLSQRLEHLLRHDPKTEMDQIRARAERLVPEAKAALDRRKAVRREQSQYLATLPTHELRQHFHNHPDLLPAREIRALEEILRLADSNSQSSRSAIQELLTGLRNYRRSPVPERVGALTPWRLWLQNMDRTIGHGTTPALNLAPGAISDASRRDPLPSGFWRRPQSISTQDVASGFGRAAVPDYTIFLWDYAGPKTSAGTHAGFDVRAGKLRLKVKFGEEHSEPFTARIFHALGYNVDPTDCVSEMKVRYSRRLFREFNMRQPLPMRLRPFWIPVATLDLQPYHDPFNFIRAAVTKDGRRLSGSELKAALLLDPHGDRPENDPANFNPEFEMQLSHLLIGPVNVQPEDSLGENVGAWDFGGLGHEDLRELRGAGLLAAWLGWFDARFDNTRLRIVRDGDRTELRFFFSDLGAGMGSGRGYLTRNGEQLAAMEDCFTSPEIVRGPGHMTTPFRVRNFETIVPVPAFQRMTSEDARWMGRMIGALTREQLRSALLASGYDAPRAERYLEKLLKRRSIMLLNLALAPDVP